MGFLDKFRQRKPDLSESERYRMVSRTPDGTAEQAQSNRDLMEAGMAKSREKLDDTNAEKQD